MTAPAGYRPTKAVKATVAAIALVAGALTAAFGDDVFDWRETGEFVALVGEAVVGTWAVWKVKNPPKENSGERS